MKENVLVKYLGIDSWDRKVYKVLNKNNTVLKQYPNECSFYLAYGFEGEPHYPLSSEKYNVVVFEGCQYTKGR